VKVLVFPKNGNPYQELLYAGIRRRGIRVNYIGRSTPFHGLSILLLPLEMAAKRSLGAKVVHLHWVFSFNFPGAGRFRWILLASQAWFILWLRSCKLLGLRLIWTAHNVLPHEPVFADDIAMRKTLVSACDLVIVHSEAALSELAKIGAIPKRSVVIPHGPFAPNRKAAVLRQPGSDGSPYRFLFIGRLKAYKGVDELLEAFEAIRNDVKLHLTIAGQCEEPALLARLESLTGRDDLVVIAGPEELSAASMSDLLSASDVVVLPFKKITTSGSAILALSHGRPIIIPDAQTMSDIPENAAHRYDGTVAGLGSAMTAMAGAGPDQLARMGEAAMAHANSTSWDEIAERTISAMTDTLLQEYLWPGQGKSRAWISWPVPRGRPVQPADTGQAALARYAAR
jgi:glycosyltransferase involved in cell wall biosynthesis